MSVHVGRHTEAIPISSFHRLHSQRRTEPHGHGSNEAQCVQFVFHMNPLALFDPHLSLARQSDTGRLTVRVVDDCPDKGAQSERQKDHLQTALVLYGLGSYQNESRQSIYGLDWHLQWKLYKVVLPSLNFIYSCR